MCCEQIKRQLGRCIDNELSAAKRGEVEAHLERCLSCRCELEKLRELSDGIARPVVLELPDAIWAGIEQRLDQAERTVSPARPLRRPRSRSVPWGIAAGVVLAVGLGMFGWSSHESSVHASTVNFGVLLDALPLDAQKAFRKFLELYDAKPTTPIEAKRIASDLNFNTPATLPGGFRLQAVYELRIGRTKGIAVEYDRDGEFLAAVFHVPMKHEKFGSHESFPCVIGEHCGHMVQVGEWKLVHLTDPTTCHCLLSRLDEQSEMPKVLAAIAPGLHASLPNHEPTHPQSHR